MFLPIIYKEWNKRRGHGEKIKGLGVLMGSWLIYMGLVHFLVGGTREQFLYIAGAIVLATLIMFMWFWGSKFWANGFNTDREKGFFLAEKWASMRYIKNTPKWKRSALWFVCTFKTTLAFTLIGIACLNPLIPFVGLLGGKIEGIYNDAFHPHDSTTLARAETESGLFIGYLVTISVILHGIGLHFKPLIINWF